MAGRRTKTFDELADHLGESGAERLLQYYAGQRISFPKKWRPDGATGALGEEFGTFVSEQLGGSRLEIPRTGNLPIPLVLQRMWDDGCTVNEIASELGYTERHARRLTDGLKFKGLPSRANRDGVVRAGLSEGMSFRKIAAQSGCSPAVVERLAKRMGLYENFVLKREALILQAHAGGFTQADIARHLDCSGNAVDEATKKHNLNWKIWRGGNRKRLTMTGQNPVSL